MYPIGYTVDALLYGSAITATSDVQAFGYAHALEHIANTPIYPISTVSVIDLDKAE